MRKYQIEGIDALKSTYDTETGRKAIEFILLLTHLFETSAASTDNTNEIIFLEGERSIGLQIMKALNLNTTKLWEIYHQEKINNDFND